MKKEDSKMNEKIVEEYFELIQMLRNGDEDSIEKLMKLWNDDGVFEFSGSAPLIGTFKGEMAIRTLYSNRLKSNGIKLKLHDGDEKLRPFTLGLVRTDVSHMRTKENKVIVGWKTTIGTEQGAGFDVAGSHLFTFNNRKIQSLRVTISPKAEDSSMKELSLSALSIQDVGRLSLAAWPVV